MYVFIYVVAFPATVSRVGTIFVEPEKVVGTEAQVLSMYVYMYV